MHLDERGHALYYEIDPFPAVSTKWTVPLSIDLPWGQLLISASSPCFLGREAELPEREDMDGSTIKQPKTLRG